MSEEELHREILSGTFSMQVADCERNIRIQFQKLQQENQRLKEVIEEVREKIKTCYFKIDNHSDKYNSFSLYLKLKDTNTGEELLQILDKAKGEDNGK